MGASLDLLGAALYAYGGHLVAKRAMWTPSGRAIAFFAIFWYAVAFTHALQALLTIIATVREPALEVALSIWHARIVLALVAFLGLVYYLLAVYADRPGLLAPLVVFYVLLYILIEGWMAWSRPNGVVVEDWRIRLEFVRDPAGWKYLGVIMAFFLPPLLSTIGYALLVHQLDDPARRYRARLIALSLIVFFVGAIFGYANVEWPWWGLVEQFVGIIAGLGLLVALQPPQWARERYHARDFVEMEA